MIEGDLNIHVDIADDADAIRLRGLLESTGLEQHVTVPTHTSGHTLDLIITKQSDAFEIPTPWTDYLFSDHFRVHCKLKIDKPPPKKSQILFRKLKSINVDSLHEELAESDLCKNLQSYDLNGLVRCYNNTRMSAIDRHAPVITKTVTKRPIVPWFTREVIKLAKRERRRAEKQWHRTMLHSDFLIFKAKKNHATFNSL